MSLSELADVVSSIVGSLEAALQKRHLTLTVNDLASLPNIQADLDLIQQGVSIT